MANIANKLYNSTSWNSLVLTDIPPDSEPDWANVVVGIPTGSIPPQPAAPEESLKTAIANARAARATRIVKGFSAQASSFSEEEVDNYFKKYAYEAEDEKQPKKPPENPMDINSKKIYQVIATASYDPGSYPRVDVIYEAMKIEPPKFKLPVIAKSPDVFVGIEIEVENVIWGSAGLNAISSLFNNVWNIVEDASLRNHGREFVSRVGIKAQDIPKALEIFKHFMAVATNGKSEATYRCGTHVHIDVRTLTIGQYINMLSLYILFEDYFYRLAGEGRKENIFCVPINGSECGVSGLYALLRKEKPTPKDFKRLFSRFSKYMAYNLRPTGFVGSAGRPVTPIGTVEFRHHEGCSDTLRLSNWVQAIVDLYHTAQQFTCQELLDLIFNLNSISTYKEFATSVFTNPIALTDEGLEECMYQGSRHIKELYLEEEEEA